MRLRIAVWHDPPMGGAQRSFSEMLRRLAERGHSIDVYRTGQPNDDATSETAYGIRVETVPFHRHRHRRLAAYWNDLMTLRDMREEERLEEEMAATVDKAEYDVLLVSVLRNGTAPSILRFSSIPTVYYCHEPPRRFYEPWCRPEAGPLTPFERGRMLWRWPTQQLIERWSQRHDYINVRSASLILTNSQYTRRRVREVYDREAQVCYLGVDSHRFHPALDRRSRVGIVSVGALEAHKGFDFLIEALGLLPKQLRPPLTIVGSGGHPGMPRHLYRLAAQCGVDLQIRTGLTDSELLDLYQSSAAFVFGARMEPFGLVLLEAMAAGLPIVAVAEGGVPEIVKDKETGFLTERSPRIFAEPLAALLSSPDLQKDFGERAREVAERDWSWEATADTLEGYLASVVANTPATQGAS